MRLAVYTDYTYVAQDGRVYAERAFALFLARLAARFDRFTLVGRLSPSAERARYEIPPEAEFAPLPYYESLSQPVSVARALVGSVRRFWRALDGADAVWLLGPHPLAIAFAVLARVRGRRVLLGVRQDTRAYVRARHPGRRGLHAVAALLEGIYAVLSRAYPTVVVGPALRRRFRRAGALLELTVSLVTESDLLGEGEALARPYDGELRIISVGRLDEEKNPLMLAETLAELADGGDDRWQLEVCGEGPLAAPLEARLAELGLEDRARLRGYVAAGDEMISAYRASHFLLHTSWTEGLPQVLLEAFAAGLPVVATDVGGIREGVGTAAVLVPAGNTGAAAAALRRLADDEGERERMIRSALAHVRAHTLDAEVDRLAEFIHAEAAPR